MVLRYRPRESEVPQKEGNCKCKGPKVIAYWHFKNQHTLKQSRIILECDSLGREALKVEIMFAYNIVRGPEKDFKRPISLWLSFC